jgi:hypothetical protein
MPAIAPHSTEVVTGSWDGPGNVANIPNDAGAATLRAMFTWHDPDKDPETKTAYKLPHHVVTNGTPKAASANGVRAALQRLRQSAIQEGDHEAVRRHLNAHLAKLREASSSDTLVRAYRPGVELRAAADGASMPTLFGHFAVFNHWTEIDSVFEGRFLERIAPGAFSKTFAENRDQMRCLFQHGRDPVVGDKPLGPFQELREDSVGAYYEVPMLDTSYNRDLIPGLEADQYGASFRFRVMKDEWVDEPPRSDHNPGRIPERTLLEVRTFEAGPVTFPAYAGATAGLRSLTDFFWPASLGELDPASLHEIADRMENTRTPDGTGAGSTTPDDGAATPGEEPREHSELTVEIRNRLIQLRHRRYIA